MPITANLQTCGMAETRDEATQLLQRNDFNISGVAV